MERSFALVCETGGTHRTWLRGLETKSQEISVNSRRSQPWSDPEKTTGPRQTQRVRGTLGDPEFDLCDRSHCHQTRPPTLPFRGPILTFTLSFKTPTNSDFQPAHYDRLIPGIFNGLLTVSGCPRWLNVCAGRRLRRQNLSNC